MFPGSFGPDRECWQLIYIIRSVLGYILIAIPGNSEIPFRSCDHNRSSIQLVAMLVCWTQSSYTLLQSTCELSLTIYTNFSRASTLPSLRLTTTWFIVNIIRSWSKGLPSCCLPNSWGCVDFYSSSTLVSHISNLLRPSKINKHGLFLRGSRNILSLPDIWNCPSTCITSKRYSHPTDLSECRRIGLPVRSGKGS